MLETVLCILAVSAFFALCGAVGERMMRYGKEQGIVKGNYEVGDERKEKAPDVGASDADM